jgi:AraC-like DNA-binding protein
MAAARGRRIHLISFSRKKYGRELLIDAALLSDLPAFRPVTYPHVLGYHDVLLVTEGRGTFWIDDDAHPVEPGIVYFTRPGDIRRWDVEHVDGACLFFTDDLVREAFSDARFLDQFAYFARPRPASAVKLARAEQREFLRRFRTMTREIRDLRPDAPHLLRAVLYELLVRLNRWYVERLGAAIQSGAPTAVERFRLLVERDFAHSHRVSAYSARVNLTPGHLTALCRERLGRSASSVIRERLVLEAKRRLLYTEQRAFAIAAELGFADASYFGRFFRRETGLTPRQFRERRRRSPA